MLKSQKVSRRQFLANSAAAAAATIVPRYVIGGSGYQPPSDTLNIACVGVGGKGRSDVQSVSSENIVAMCDVDSNNGRGSAETFAKFPKAKKYVDFRRMFDEMEESIDAVTVSTPDHTHFIIAMWAIKRGKHTFVQKPLTHSILEARALAKAAKEAGVMTQMGNQGHAGEEARLINEWIWEGAIGTVREAYAWTNRPIWPQAIDRPQEIPAVPGHLDWDQWVGPAPYRPYHPVYVPFKWRGWWDFGTGALGDMGAHIIDHPYWALKFGDPSTIQASSTSWNEETYPLASKVEWTFPARGDMPQAKLHWYDGGLMPPRPEELEKGRQMGDAGGGVIFVGDKGKLMCSVYGRNPRLIPESFMQEYGKPEQQIPRSPGIHEEWIRACKGGPSTTSNFEYAGALTETMLLGNVAIRFQHQNTILEWDSERMQVTNLTKANTWLDSQKEYRYGWNW